MRLYIKGDYTKTDFYDEFKEIAQKMWFKERKGIPLDFSYAWDEYLHLNLRLDKFKHNDERWESANFYKNINPWKTFEYENLTLDLENSYESDGREKGDYLRIISTHLDILTVDKRAMYVMAIEIASAIDGQISEDDKETWLSIEEFKMRHANLLQLSYDKAVDISLEELEVMEVVDEPLWDDLHKGWEEYIAIHGEVELDDEDDE
ncbi:hypothetical protein UA01_01164 [Streptococcus parasanguinis]|uniref:Uncharacterized protein n=1 Tax=Streptococcus parasanguinis FW213 TaxID=1114965 RepID=I1ZMU1_STRPA|nr:hypothetical protein [Streptococcus parasanguinis]AFJ26365.1 hypothetical protein Spaf_1391 [Streptococcus parasanguinis FW213]KJU98404.1 hypothetical protein UA01_01164 [Streptococcus parasanguinis]